jgi:hypothetical protein
VAPRAASGVRVSAADKRLLLLKLAQLGNEGLDVSKLTYRGTFVADRLRVLGLAQRLPGAGKNPDRLYLTERGERELQKPYQHRRHPT